MIKVFIVEDEEKILKTTLKILEDLPVEVLGHATNIEDAFQGIISKRPDLLLLDIELGDSTSFELLDKFDELPFQVVFTTAHQKYALDAFKFSAIDYLLKPISISALKKVLERVGNTIDKSSEFSLRTLKYNLKHDSQDQKLILKTQEKIYVFKLNDIIRCDSDQSYTIFYTKDEKLIVSKTLGYYDDLLSKFGFYRVHKSHLINLHHIIQFHKYDGEIEMIDGNRVSVSQRRKEEFLHLVGDLGLS